MKHDCLAFRTLLERKLVGRPDPSSLTELSWHGHLHACADCRELFEGEEALEALLASWPEPVLAPDVKHRVLVALAKSREFETSLDALLERDRAFHAPKDLAARVLAGLEKSRSELAPADPLDRLLDRAGAVEVPHGLSGRVLAGLTRERAPVRRPLLAQRRSLWLAAAAALVVMTLAIWLVKRRENVEVSPRTVENQPAPRTPDAQMLAALDVLENWDLLMQTDDDVDALLSTLGADEEILLDFQDEG
jgi:hypothetical protein